MDIANRKHEAEEQWIVIQLCDVAGCVSPDLVMEFTRLARAYLARKVSAEDVVAAAKLIGVKRASELGQEIVLPPRAKL